MCASKLALVLRRHDVVSAAPSFVFRMFCRFPFQSVRYLMCVIVGVFFRIGVLVAGPP